MLFVLGALVLGCGGDDPASSSARKAATKLDGRIVFDDGDGPVYTINPDGTDRVQIGFGHDVAHWSHDGRRIAMSAETPDERVTTALVNPDGTGLTTQTIPDPTLSLVCWAWTPDDARLACEAWDDSRKDRRAGIFRVRKAGWDGLTRLTANPYGGHDIPGAYSPSGRRIAFAREDPTRQKVAMFVTGHGAVRRVSPWQSELSTPDWSPNGRRLIYDDGNGSLIVVRPDGARRREVRLALDAPGRAFQPAWSPDGRRIVFVLITPRRGKDDLEGIYTAKANGRDVRAVATTTTGFFNNPDWGYPPADQG